MNPLIKDKYFLLIAVPTTLLLIWSAISVTVGAIDKYEFVLVGSEKAWHMAAKLYQIPLSIAAGLLAIFALFTSLHRVALQADQTRLQTAQVEEARKLNEFNIYFKQREEFDKKFLAVMGEWYKQVHRNIDFRNHEWFEIRNPYERLGLQVEDERLKRIASIACFNLYEFCFGSGRPIYLTLEFQSFVRQIFKLIVQIAATIIDDEKAKAKAQLNEIIADKLAVTQKFPDWCHLYNSDWFSVNEKFNLSLAITRLFAEIEAFAGAPRNIDCIDEVIAPGQSAEHAPFFGPNLLMGERLKSPGGAEGRMPQLQSQLLGNPSAHGSSG